MPFPTSNLSSENVLRDVHDQVTQSLRTTATATIVVPGGLDVAIDHTEDSIRLGNGTNFITSTSATGKVALDVNLINASDIGDIRPLNVLIDSISAPNVESRLDSLLTELQLKADVTEAQNIRNLTSVSDSVSVPELSNTNALLTTLNTDVAKDSTLNNILTTLQNDLKLFLSGSASANNTNLISDTDVSNYDTIIIQTQGTFSATMQAQFSNDGINWISVLTQSLTGATTAPNVSMTTTNTIYKVPVSGRYFRLRTTTYTSGTVNVHLYISTKDIVDFGQRSNSVSGNVSVQAASALVNGTGSAVNTTPVASTAVSQYDTATFSLVGTWVATLQAEGTNNGTDWFTLPVIRVDQNPTLPIQQITSNGLYRTTLDVTNFRVRIVSYTSGTVSASARISLNGNEAINLANVIADPDDLSRKLKINLDGSIDVVPITKAATPGIVNVNLTIPLTRYSYAFPTNTKRFTIKLKDNGKMEIGLAPTGPALTVGPGGYYSEDGLSTNFTVFISSSKANDVAEIVHWT